MVQLADQSAAHHVIDTILDVFGQRFLRNSPVARERTLEQGAMFGGRSLAAVDGRYRRSRHHLEAPGAFRLDQRLGRQAIQYFTQRADA